MSDILLEDDARNGIRNGINKVSDTVSRTAGPKGRNVVLAQGHGASINTNDGVTVARAISLDDPVEDLGAHMVKEVATNTEEATGDGTTTATILLQSLVEGGLKTLATKMDPNCLKVGMAKITNKLVEALDQMSVEVKDNETLRKVATISANNDDSLGELIAEAFAEAGETGEVAVTESGTFDTKLEVVEGLRFDRGYMHRVFINNIQSMRADLENPNILVTEKKIKTSNELMPILEELSKTDNPRLLLISDDIEFEVLNSIAMAKAQGNIDITCVKAPGFGDSRVEMLEDIATIVGATLIGTAHKLTEVKLSDLGKAEYAYIGRDESTIIGGQGDTIKISERIDHVKAQLKRPDLEDHPINILKKRLGYLKGGVAVLYVGAASDTELTEKKYRIEDAIGATRSAVAEGIVPGGGLALIRAAEKIRGIKISDNEEEEAGIKIVLDAIRRPFDKILQNAGYTPDVVLAKVLEKDDFYGLNVKTGEYGDLMELGVVDPVKVTKTALLNAVSVAGLFLTTEAVVFEKND